VDERRALAATLEDARARTLAPVGDLSDGELRVPYLRIVNPFLWEIGHVAWFQEKWMLRHVAGAPPLRSGGDALHDSAKVEHSTRWHLPLPTRAETLRYMRATLDRAVESLLADELTPARRYFAWLALFHEDMHGEAFTYTRQTLGLRGPPHATREPEPGGALAGDVELPGGRFVLGAARTDAFVFDNDLWAHEVEIAPFRLARAATTQRELAEFADDGGCSRRGLGSARTGARGASAGLAQGWRRVVAPRFRPLGRARARPPRDARQRLPSRGLLSVERPPPSDGGRVGVRGVVGRRTEAGVSVGRRARARGALRARRARRCVARVQRRRRARGGRRGVRRAPDARQRVGVDRVRIPPLPRVRRRATRQRECSPRALRTSANAHSPVKPTTSPATTSSVVPSPARDCSIASSDWSISSTPRTSPTFQSCRGLSGCALWQPTHDSPMRRATA
jgi:hypothetical protein